MATLRRLPLFSATRSRNLPFDRPQMILFAPLESLSLSLMGFPFSFIGECVDHRARNQAWRPRSRDLRRTRNDRQPGRQDLPVRRNDRLVYMVRQQGKPAERYVSAEHRQEDRTGIAQTRARQLLERYAGLARLFAFDLSLVTSGACAFAGAITKGCETYGIPDLTSRLCLFKAKSDSGLARQRQDASPHFKTGASRPGLRVPAMSTKPLSDHAKLVSEVALVSNSC